MAAVLGYQRNLYEEWVMQLSLDMEPLPTELKVLETRAREEMATKKMKLAGLKTMEIFTTKRLRYELSHAQ